jgi:hypothetical protein
MNKDYYSEMLPSWGHPTGFDSAANFIGQVPQGYCIYSQNRDSSILERTNFTVILEQLGGEGEHVEVVKHSHWACGWIEYIIVDKQAPNSLLDTCVDILRALSDYPVMSDERYSDAQYEAIHEHWENLRMRERIDLCIECGESIFAARRDMPESVYESLSTDIY